MKEMAFVFVANTVIAVNTSKAPSDEEWKSFMDLLRRVAKTRGDLSHIRHLTYTEGGTPNAAQRRQASDELQQIKGWKESPAAIVSSSAVVRGVVTVLHWFNLNARSFTPEELEQALRFLKISPEESVQVLTELDTLKVELGMKPTLHGKAGHR